ncbi:hypothetical protein [Georgenia wangjunii]|uniref:hypothetical protein n=1 Tax=Georgenia wangjunii TaxID=3117730 RepID=UPI002F26488D
MTAHWRSRDGEGSILLPATGDLDLMAVHVYGGVGRTRVDTAELVRLGEALDEARRLLRNVETSLLRARGHARLEAGLAPATAPGVVRAADEALEGSVAVATLDRDVEHLEACLCQARIFYAEAEEGSRPLVGALSEPSAFAFLQRLLSPGAFIGRAVGSAVVSTGMLAGRPLTVLPDRSGLELALTTLHVPGRERRTPHGVATQRAVREAGAEAQHYVPWFLLPEELTVGGRRLVPGEMSPGERALLPLALGAGVLPALVVGDAAGRYGVEVTAVLPPRRVPPARGAGDTLRAMARLMPGSGGAPGTVEVRRTVHRDGRRTWTVLVPGTQNQGGGGRNPMDNLTNVEAYAGLSTDVEAGVVRAMEQAGIPPGEEVALVGHSQGGMTAMRLAADPVVALRFTVATVLTAGSPVGHMPTPPGVDVLHLEHLEDMVPGLDGVSAPRELRRTTVARSLTTGTTGPAGTAVTFSSAHALGTYAQTADLAEVSGDASVSYFAERTARIAGGPGATVTSTVFQVSRVAG